MGTDKLIIVTYKTALVPFKVEVSDNIRRQVSKTLEVSAYYTKHVFYF